MPKGDYSEWTAVDSQTNAAATASKAAPTAPQRHCITTVGVSFSGTPATALRLLIQENSGGTTLWSAEIPAASTSPIQLNFVRPLRATIGKDVKATIGAAGAGIVCDVCLAGYTASA